MSFVRGTVGGRTRALWLGGVGSGKLAFRVRPACLRCVNRQH